MNWQRVVVTLTLTLAPLAAGIALVAIGERDIGMLMLGVGGGALGVKGIDQMPSKLGGTK